MAVWWLLAAPTASKALEGATISPLQGIHLLNVDILMGAGLDPSGDHGPTPSLFRGDFGRADAFAQQLRADIADILEQCNIRVSTDAIDTLQVAIYGRPIQLEGQPIFELTMLQVRVLDDPDNGCDCTTLEVPAIQTFLGFVPDGDLEKSLTSQVRQILTKTAACHPIGESGASPRNAGFTTPIKE